MHKTWKKYIYIIFLCKLLKFSDDKFRKDKFLGNMNKEQLLALSRWKHNVFYCTCPHEQFSGNTPENNYTCSKNTIVNCSMEENPALNTNNCRIRSKRSAVKPFSYKMFKRQDIKFTDFDEVCVLSLYSKKFLNNLVMNRKYLGSAINQFSLFLFLFLSEK